MKKGYIIITTLLFLLVILLLLNYAYLAQQDASRTVGQYNLDYLAGVEDSDSLANEVTTSLVTGIPEGETAAFPSLAKPEKAYYLGVINHWSTFDRWKDYYGLKDISIDSPEDQIRLAAARFGDKGWGEWTCAYIVRRSND